MRQENKMMKRNILAFFLIMGVLALPCSVFGYSGNATLIPAPKETPKPPTAKGTTKGEQTPPREDPKKTPNSTGFTQSASGTTDTGVTSSPSETNALVTTSNKEAKLSTEEEFDWTFIAKLVLSVIASLLVIGGLSWLIYVLYQNKQRERAEIRGAFSDLKTKDNSLNQKIEALTKLTGEMNQQIVQQRSDIQRLQKNLADSSGSSFAPPPPVPSQPKEPPRFPIGVTDYLAKFGQNSTPVKFDYKEGILVSDPTNEGCLMIVNDGGSVYVVPSYGFFQTKSDYTNYFEKYYSCARPMGGNAWIVQPASVNQVAGGWQLASMGELEIR